MPLTTRPGVGWCYEPCRWEGGTSRHSGFKGPDGLLPSPKPHSGICIAQTWPLGPSNVLEEKLVKDDVRIESDKRWGGGGPRGLYWGSWVRQQGVEEEWGGLPQGPQMPTTPEHQPGVGDLVRTALSEKGRGQGVKSVTLTHTPHIPFPLQNQRGAGSFPVQEPGQEFPQVAWPGQLQVRGRGRRPWSWGLATSPPTQGGSVAPALGCKTSKPITD